MKPMLIVVLVVAPWLTLAAALKRASWDWEYQLRLIVVLGLLNARDAPVGSPILEQVRLIEPVGGNLNDALLLTCAYNAGRRSTRFHLDEPLGQRARLCSRWLEDGTPLLLAIDDRGAVLHGPDGVLLGGFDSRGSASEDDLDGIRWR